ncbi:hypothetical protein J3459_022393 [Metarhizium acridum]|nr:hypothetical protein J3459_022393 [Metarhizium acridum]
MAIGAATLASSVAAQVAGKPAVLDPAKDIIPIIPSDALKNVEGDWKYDACHKIDTSVSGGFIWPCASQLKILVESCPTSANSAEQRKAQRDCVCGKGSSFLRDAVACSECKMQNGLQPDNQRDFWKEYYAALDKEYCQPEQVAVGYNEFARQLTERKSPPAGVITGNPLDGKIADPREYYRLAGVDVPEKQGPGKSTPAVPQPGANNNTVKANTTIVNDPVAGQVVVPAFIAVEVNNKTSGANTASVTPTPSAAGSQPTTLMRVTSWNSTAKATASSLSPSSSLVPASGPNSGANLAHVILINGKLCHVYIIWVTIDCSPKKDAQGKLYIEYKNTGIDNNKPISMLEDKEQFDKIKDTMHDASKDKNCAKQLKEIVGTEAKVVTSPGNNKPLPPPEKPTAGESKGSNVNAGPDTSDKPVTGTKPAAGNNTPGVSSNDDDCVDEAVPSGANTPGNGSTNTPSTQNTQSPPSGGAETLVPGPNGTKTTPNSPAQNSASTPGDQAGSNTPVNSGSQPETKDCDCPPGSKTPERKDATEICAKKVKTETDCKKEPGENMRKCLCSEGSFKDQRFFDEAIICSRRSADCLWGEYGAQVFFQTKYLYCDLKLFGDDFAAAYKNVSDSWTARAPSASLM